MVELLLMQVIDGMTSRVRTRETHIWTISNALPLLVDYYKNENVLINELRNVILNNVNQPISHGLWILKNGFLLSNETKQSIFVARAALVELESDIIFINHSNHIQHFNQY